MDSATMSAYLTLCAAALTLACGCGGDDDGAAPCAPDEFDENCEVIDCHQAELCEVDCPGGAFCPDIDCTDADECILDCSGGSLCALDCDGAATCDMTCSGGSDCELDCGGALDCTAACTGGSPCLIDCEGAEGCDFVECSGGSGAVECEGDFLACNRDCPACGDGVCDWLVEDSVSCGDDC
jgi:hypothetical protein